MKKIIYIFTIALIIITGNNIYSQEAGEALITGVNGAMYIPAGSLSTRFKPAAGASIEIGKEVSEDWTWTGKIEYFKYDRLNSDKLFVTRSVKVDYFDKRFQIPLPKLKMSLEVTGLTANAAYNLYSNNFIRTDLEFGFGVYRWFNKRGEYRDSLYADTSGTGGLKLAQVANVSESNQEDWSGGLNLGFGVNVNIYKPVSFYASANYKVIIGELWPALALDLENVSSMQMFELRVGLRARF